MPFVGDTSPLTTGSFLGRPRPLAAVGPPIWVWENQGCDIRLERGCGLVRDFFITNPFSLFTRPTKPQCVSHFHTFSTKILVLEQRFSIHFGLLSHFSFNKHPTTNT